MTLISSSHAGSGLISAQPLAIVGPAVFYVPGTSGNDTLIGDPTGDNIMTGYGGNDIMRGKGFVDDIWGGNGNDSLFGAGGGDRLYGGNGADQLQGDGGNDRLQGGAGADQFIFRANNGNDRIVDWQEGIDQIKIVPGVNITVAINYSGPDALVTLAEIGVTILVEDVANGSLQLSQSGNTFFLS